MSDVPAALRADWDSEYRDHRDFLAVLVTTLVALSPPYLLLFSALGSAPVGSWGAVIDNNLGLVTVVWLWTLIVATAFGGRLLDRYRDL